MIDVEKAKKFTDEELAKLREVAKQYDRHTVTNNDFRKDEDYGGSCNYFQMTT